MVLSEGWQCEVREHMKSDSIMRDMMVLQVANVALDVKV